MNEEDLIGAVITGYEGCGGCIRLKTTDGREAMIWAEGDDIAHIRYEFHED